MNYFKYRDWIGKMLKVEGGEKVIESYGNAVWNDVISLSDLSDVMVIDISRKMISG